MNYSKKYVPFQSTSGRRPDRQSPASEVAPIGKPGESRRRGNDGGAGSLPLPSGRESASGQGNSLSAREASQVPRIVDLERTLVLAQPRVDGAPVVPEESQNAAHRITPFAPARYRAKITLRIETRR